MKISALVIAVCVLSALMLRAADSTIFLTTDTTNSVLEHPDPFSAGMRFDLSTEKKEKGAINWTDQRWGVLLLQKPSTELPPLTIGKSDFVLGGPLIDTFRLPRRYTSEERTLGQKILDLPIINLFVPAPFPKPTRQGKYFYWGEREQAWTTQMDRPIELKH